MHDPTRSAASLAPQNAPNGSPSRRHKLFSVLPEKAPSVLAKDTVSIENPALAWPHRSLETRRIFQDLFCRFVSGYWPSFISPGF